ncbi:DNA-binding transcriptional regulator, MocR family, contains an aminotransferase domain [Thermomonospora echinospora]|uniref:DNA-binding transcriptional regulator, MocR family, contains an aminotransferase domain n=1 Tax=Thermomonospora echinospora TaxID=1992 RepID=A0A1H6BLE1_9ACTN|nr:DNA-binding transcriptional regulator, MocR family, contains an aminotransferase domain [Thermomonospora echinospora]
MERHRVSPVTVSRALARLAAEGLVVTRPGSGTFVAERPRPARAPRPADHGWQAVALGDRTVDPAGLTGLLTAPPEGIIPLGCGYLLASLQPLQALATAAARAARRPDAWERPPLAGIDGLRTWFARAIGGQITPADVLITDGGQHAITIALRALLPPGAPLLVESPTYQGALAVARAAGLHTVPVPVDDEGVRPDLLADAFAMTGARVFYCQPTFQNPTGAVLTGERRRQVLAVARAAGAFVVEDDFARHLGVEPAPAPLAADDPDGRVVHIASLTKASAPSLRIAALTARGPVAERLRAVQVVDSFFPSRHLQETALELVSSPAWERHRRTVRTALRDRRDALAAALARELPELRFEPPGGGMYLWVRLPDGVDETTLVEAAWREGVLVNPGRPCFPAEPDGPHLRISFGMAASEAELAEGVRRLARALATMT